MKSSTKLFTFVLIVLFIVLASYQLAKNLQIENVLNDDYFTSETTLRIEKINRTYFTEINTSKKIEEEMKVLLKGLKLKRTDDSYSPLDADYRIVSTSNLEDQMYLFVEENVIVFPHKSSTGYKIRNKDDFMKKVVILLS